MGSISYGFPKGLKERAGPFGSVFSYEKWYDEAELTDTGDMQAIPCDSDFISLLPVGFQKLLKGQRFAAAKPSSFSPGTPGDGNMVPWVKRMWDDFDHRFNPPPSPRFFFTCLIFPILPLKNRNFTSVPLIPSSQT